MREIAHSLGRYTTHGKADILSIVHAGSRESAPLVRDLRDMGKKEHIESKIHVIHSSSFVL